MVEKERWIRRWRLDVTIFILGAVAIDLLLSLGIFKLGLMGLFLVKYLLLVPGIWFVYSKYIAPALNHKLWQKMQQQMNYISFMERINHIMISNLKFQENFVDFIRELKRQVDFDRCVVFRVNEDGNRYSVYGFYDGIQELNDEQKTYSLNNSFLQETVQSRKPKVFNGTIKEKYWDSKMLGARVKSYLQIPMIYQDEVIGVFLISSQEERTLTYASLNFLEPVVERLAVALQNCYLFHETKALSLKDYLTDTANRRALDMQLEYEFRRAKRYNEPFSILVIDLDYFKTYNDTYGHLAGDQALKDIATIMKNEVREIDLVARFGGEEFVVLLPGTDREQAGAVAERIRRKVSEHLFMPTAKTNARLTVSIGVATYSGDDGEDGLNSIKKILHGADLKLYSAKSHGRNKVVQMG